MKILVRLPNWLGDLVMSAGFLEHLANIYPNATIDVIVKKGIDQLAHYFNGINNIYVFDKQSYPGLKGAALFGKQIKAKQQYDLAFCLPDSFSSATMIWRSGAAKRIGFKKELRSFLLTNSYNKPGHLHRVEQYLLMLEKFTGVKCSNPVVRLKNTFQKAQNTILVNVNSEADSRRLPVEKAISILNLLRSQMDAEIIMVGSPKELPHVSAVYNGLINKTAVTNLAGKTDLNGLIEVFSKNSVMLTTDSGPMHLANSLGVHTVALEGASDERNTAPYDKANSTLIRYGKLPCEPCVKNTCKFGQPICLLRMDEHEIVQAVLAAVKKQNE